MSGNIEDEQVEGLFARGKSETKGSGSKGKYRSHKNVECYYCHEIGHIIKNCPKLKAKNGNGKEKVQEAASVATATTSDSKSDDYVLMTTLCSGERWFDFNGGQENFQNFGNWNSQDQDAQWVGKNIVRCATCTGSENKSYFSRCARLQRLQGYNRRWSNDGRDGFSCGATGHQSEKFISSPREYSNRWSFYRVFYS
ncbi:uncharacterized protein LOC132307613 [Cornus florida]|uniref:uncharacterized protein LOC132307613 n=1 Tax=Cornus florida TaxID=4283 RepID=UPI0028A1D4EA|nr:uncharacterized protein LOC132307613 [Cornus florida]